MEVQENMSDIQNYLDNFQKDLQNPNDGGEFISGIIARSVQILARCTTFSYRYQLFDCFRMLNMHIKPDLLQLLLAHFERGDCFPRF